MFLLFIASFIAGAAEPVALTADQQTALEVAAQFTRNNQPINISCATHPIAIEIGIDDTGWSPLCSRGTLTEVMNRLFYGGLTNVGIATEGQISDYVLIQEERERFANPRRVRETYAQLKPFVLPVVRTGKPATIAAYRTYLTEVVIPTLTLDVPASLRELYRVEAEAYEANQAARVYTPETGTYFNPATDAAYTKANLAFGNAAIAAEFHDPLALQWRLRREKEGGMPLVAAWREVIADFAHEL